MLGHGQADDGVTGLVIGGHALLFVAHDHRAALGTHKDFVFGALELLHADQTQIGTGSKQSRFVDQVSEIRTREARRATGNKARLDVIAQRQLAHVHAQYLFAAAHIRQRHDHLTVETAGAQQGRIEHIGAVGGGDDDDALVALEAVHLDQQLVESLLTLVVTAAQTSAAMATDCVDFVDEDNAGRVLFSLLEHVPHA